MLKDKILMDLLKTNKESKYNLKTYYDNEYLINFNKFNLNYENINVYKVTISENQYKTGDYSTYFTSIIDVMYFLNSSLLHNLLANSNMFDRIIVEHKGEVILNLDKHTDKLV